jgi:transposase
VARPAKYPDEFRREAVALVRSSDRPVAEVARSLGIAEGTLWNWVRADRDAAARAADPNTLSESEPRRAEAVAEAHGAAGDRSRDPAQGSRLFRA